MTKHIIKYVVSLSLLLIHAEENFLVQTEKQEAEVL